MSGILQRERTSPNHHVPQGKTATPQARNEKAASPVIPPLSETGNAFEHHADGGEAWMDRAAEEGMVDPQLTGYGLGDTVSCYSRCSTPEEHDDEHGTPISAPTPAVFAPINKDKRQVTVDVEDTKGGAKPPPAKKRKTEKQMTGPKTQESVEKVQLNEAQRTHRQLHERAKLLKPNHTVSDTRYWIGVLRDGVPLGKVKESGDIMWLKGHKSTCVKTVYHTYKQHAIPPGDFRLQLRDEFPEKNDVMEELDLYADRMIIFRCCVFHHIIDDSDEDE
ncbi:hypothetical protein BDZ85DRAFT_81126 [Elsinoe ampelina]|uniref:Uncharacterized protein n=1 Tax=Elsinoe ampelina TaxID=302913 RepID=A0A6A6FYN0_9PEZI|nr:hypothetical protein BDZ85DRAFT_81126 [Elsinoe ampelina]